MYEDLIKRLREHQCDAGEDDTQDICEECQYDVIIADNNLFSGIRRMCICGLMNQAADAIEELQKQLQKSEEDNVNLTGWLAEEHAKHLWIPVTERLPEDGSDILAVQSYCGEVRIVPANYDRGVWYDCVFNCVAEHITHWMPLPEPPKEGET